MTGFAKPLEDYTESEWDVDLRIEGDPAVKGRARVTRTGHAYTPKSTSDAQEIIRWTALAAKVKPNELDELKVDVEFHCATRQRRDIDNMVKLVFDALNGFAWRDDVQVVELVARKRLASPSPHTRIRVGIANRRARGCETCSRPLSVPQIAQDAIFCSKECYDAAQRKGHWRRCVGCGKDVYRQSERAQSSRSVYCSPECRAENKGRCRECGGLTAERARSQRRQVFCSDGCRSSWYARRPTYGRKERGKCADCGRGTSSPTAKRCRACHLKAVRARGRSVYDEVGTGAGRSDGT